MLFLNRRLGESIHLFVHGQHVGRIELDAISPTRARFAFDLDKSINVVREELLLSPDAEGGVPCASSDAVVRAPIAEAGASAAQSE